MRKFLKDYGKFFLIFIVVFLIYQVIGFINVYGDPVANYGFSYAISRGEVPYLDFNTISTPLYAFVMAPGLLIYNNYLTFIIEQSILVTLMFYFLEKTYGKICYLLFLVMSIFGFMGINPTYNFFTLFLLIVLLYLEKNYPEKDYLIGSVIGLSILTKQTIGVFFFLPTIIYYFKDIKKIIRRGVEVIGPCLLFLVYLACSGALNSFIDLCFLGLFDFALDNGRAYTCWFFISIICFIVSLIITIKNHKSISNYYLLSSFMFMIPLFDLHHFSIYVLCVVIQLLPFVRKNQAYFIKLALIVSIVYSTFLISSCFKLYKPVFNTGIKHFQYTLNSEHNYHKTLQIHSIFNQYEDPLILSYAKMFYDISSDNEIDYFDVLLYGNYGYGGSNKMIEKIKMMHDKYIIVDMEAYNEDKEDSQFDKTIVKYVLDNMTYVNERNGFAIYYKE